MNAFRIGIECARIEPEKDQWDQGVIDHYKRMVRSMTERGYLDNLTKILLLLLTGCFVLGFGSLLCNASGSCGSFGCKLLNLSVGCDIRKPFSKASLNNFLKCDLSKVLLTQLLTNDVKLSVIFS